jgi:hypothetical protein
MVNFVEEAFKVDVDDMSITIVDILLRFEYRLLGVTIGAKAITVLLKFHLEFYGYYLSYRLLQ